MNEHVQHFFDAFRYSVEGFRAAWASEIAFRQEVMLAGVLIPAALLMPGPWLGRVYLVGAMMLVLIVELLNSGLEAIVDLASPQKHSLAKRAKDCGSAAVFISLSHLGTAWTFALGSLLF